MQAVILRINSSTGSVILSTKQLEHQAGDMLHNRAAIIASAEETLELKRSGEWRKRKVRPMHGWSHQVPVQYSTLCGTVNIDVNYHTVTLY